MAVLSFRRLRVAAAVASAVAAIAVSSLPAQAAAGVRAAPDPNNVQAFRLQSEYGALYARAIEALQRHVTVSANGPELILDAPASALVGLDSTAVANLRASVAAANKKLRDGSLGVSAVALKAGVRVLDGSTGIYRYWWGTASCISHQDLQWAMWGWIGASVWVVLNLAADALGDLAILTLALFEEMDWYGNGSCFDETWTGQGWFSPQ